MLECSRTSAGLNVFLRKPSVRETDGLAIVLVLVPEAYGEAYSAPCSDQHLAPTNLFFLSTATGIFVISL